MWPLCALTGSFVWQGDLFFYAQRESGTVTSSPSCHKRRFNNLPFTLFFCAHTIEAPLRGSIQRSNLPCCCERAALQSQLWLSLQVLKWGLQKVNKLILPPFCHLPAAAHWALLEKFRRCTKTREGAIKCLLTALSRAVSLLISWWDEIMLHTGDMSAKVHLEADKDATRR